VPPLPALLPATPTQDTSQNPLVFSDSTRVSSENNTQASAENTQIFSDNDMSQDTPASTPGTSQKSVGKIVKKRKATIDDETYRPIPTDSDGDISISASEPERMVKRVKSTSKKGKRQPSRLTKKKSKSELKKEEAVVIVPDGKKVPLVPAIPNGVEGKKVKVRDDGYGGLEHEMF
jgi:hypothetical protein